MTCIHIRLQVLLENNINVSLLNKKLLCYYLLIII